MYGFRQIKICSFENNRLKNEATNDIGLSQWLTQEVPKFCIRRELGNYPRLVITNFVIY